MRNWMVRLRDQPECCKLFELPSACWPGGPFGAEARCASFATTVAAVRR